MAKVKPATMRLDDMAADPDNPRAIDDAAASGLAKSLETFGDLSMVFNLRSGQWVAGHQRIAQLKAAGATEVVRSTRMRYQRRQGQVGATCGPHGLASSSPRRMRGRWGTIFLQAVGRRSTDECGPRVGRKALGTIPGCARCGRDRSSTPASQPRTVAAHAPGRRANV
jgi:hypothetical protein